MRKLIVSEFITLDGVIQAPGGADEDRDGGFAHGGWSMPYFDPEAMGAAIGEAAEATEALLFGRRTYDGMAAAWPERTGDPFADHMNSVPKYVVSRPYSQDDLTWNNSTLLPADDVVGALVTVHSRHRIVAFSEITVFVKQRDLFVDGQLDVDRLFNVEPPDSL
jgi:dihydrofolate reductase